MTVLVILDTKSRIVSRWDTEQNKGNTHKGDLREFTDDADVAALMFDWQRASMGIQAAFRTERYNAWIEHGGKALPDWRTQK